MEGISLAGGGPEAGSMLRLLVLAVYTTSSLQRPHKLMLFLGFPFGLLQATGVSAPRLVSIGDRHHKGLHVPY